MNEQHILTAILQGQSQAAHLERLSNREFWEYAARLAAVPLKPSAPTEAYLECELKHGRCLFPLAMLREVVPPPHDVAPFPAMPIWISGVTAWRGEPVPVVDFNAYLTRRSARSRPEHMLLIVEYKEITLGFFVALVNTMTVLEPEQLAALEQIPSWCAHLPVEMVTGLYAEALVFDIPALLTDMIEQIKAMATYE